MLVLGLSVVAVPGLLGDSDGGPAANAAEPSTTTTDVPVTTTALLVTARISVEGVVLEGLVTTEGQRDALVDAARRRVGPEQVVDRLGVISSLTSSAGHDNGIVALQTLLATVPDGVTVAATTSAERLELTGEASDESALAELRSALGTAAAASPGMGTELDVEVPPPPPPTPEELTAAAQAELDELNAALRDVVLFATGSNEPTEDFTAVLDRVPDLLVRHNTVTVEVVGHTDDRGSAEGNLELSQERAEAAVAYLVGIGADSARLMARGAGEAEPIDTNTTRDGRARNRRVELVARP